MEIRYYAGAVMGWKQSGGDEMGLKRMYIRRRCAALT